MCAKRDVWGEVKELGRQFSRSLSTKHSTPRRAPAPPKMQISLLSPFSAASPHLPRLLSAPPPFSPFRAQPSSTMAIAPPGTVRTTIQHLAPLDKYQNEKPFKIMLDVSDLGHPQSNYELLEATVDVIDAQPTRDQWSMEANGFKFLSAPSQLKGDDFDDELQVKSRYYREVISAVQGLYPPGTEVHVLGYQACSDTCGSPLSNFICPLWRLTLSNRRATRGENPNPHHRQGLAIWSPSPMPTLVRLCRPSPDAVHLHDKLTLALRLQPRRLRHPMPRPLLPETRPPRPPL